MRNVKGIKRWRFEQAMPHVLGARSSLSAGYKRVLDEIVETGYMGAEQGDWGFMPTDLTCCVPSFRPAASQW